MSAPSWKPLGFAVVAVAILTQSTWPQSLGRSLLGNGGGVVAGGGYRVPGTIGQPLVGRTDAPAGPGNLVCSGWWCVERGTVVAVRGPDPSQLGANSFDRPRPNPFAAAVVLAFTLARPAAVEVAIHDVTGARVASPESRVLEVGRHEIRWDGIGRRGQPCAPGIYFVSFTVDGHVVDRRRIVLLR
jgi:hypothetical protein